MQQMMARFRRHLYVVWLMNLAWAHWTVCEMEQGNDFYRAALKAQTMPLAYFAVPTSIFML